MPRKPTIWHHFLQISGNGAKNETYKKQPIPKNNNTTSTNIIIIMSTIQRPKREDIITILRNNNADNETMNTIMKKIKLSKDDMEQPISSDLGNMSYKSYIEAVVKLFIDKRILMEELRTSEEFIHSIPGEWTAYMNRLESNASDLMRDACALKLSPQEFQLSHAISCKKDILRYSSPQINPRRKKIDELEAQEVIVSRALEILEQDHETHMKALDMCLEHLDDPDRLRDGDNPGVLLRETGEAYRNGDRKSTLATLHKLEGVNVTGFLHRLELTKDHLKILRKLRDSPEKKDKALREVATQLFQKWKLISKHQRELERKVSKEKRRRQLERERDALEWQFQKEARALQEERTRLERATTENEYLYDRKKGQLKACLDGALLNLLDDKERSDAVIKAMYVAKNYESLSMTLATEIISMLGVVDTSCCMAPERQEHFHQACALFEEGPFSGQVVCLKTRNQGQSAKRKRSEEVG